MKYCTWALTFSTLIMCFATESVNASFQLNSCVEGRQAFQETLFELIQKRSICVGCHSGAMREAPPWAVSDPDQSYARLKSFVDFVDIPQSKLVVRAGNGHCGPACRNADFQGQLSNAIREWWQNGQDKCELYHKTAAASVPDDLLAHPHQTMQWELASLGHEFSGLLLRVEISAIPSSESDITAGYILRNPEVVTTANREGCLHVQNMRMFVGDKWQWFANAFERINAMVDVRDSEMERAERVLSRDHVILPVVSFPDQLTLGFKNIRFLRGDDCLVTLSDAMKSRGNGND